MPWTDGSWIAMSYVLEDNGCLEEMRWFRWDDSPRTEVGYAIFM